MMKNWNVLDDRDDNETLPRMTEEDTEECASFLLTLKHRSVTPEPNEVMEDLSPQLAAFHPEATLVMEPLFLTGHPDDECDGKDEPSLSEELDEVASVESLIREGGGLVALEDRDLVPDSLFVAMAQMKPCFLTEADKVGCYKNREVGFQGFCCRHCEGSPGFGRFFPSTVRSLAQTTTSQTILKHVGSKCRFCPPQIRQTILELQRQQVIKESNMKKHQKAGRPRYGSRKVFFQRIWGRLHNEIIPERPLAHVEERSVMSHVSDLEDDDSVQDEIVVRKTKTNRRVLPTKKNLKRKMDLMVSSEMPDDEREPKRLRDFHLVD